MSPVYDRVNKDALQPYLAEEISQEEAMEKALAPIREFMFKQTREKDLSLFIDISKSKKPQTNPLFISYQSSRRTLRVV